MGNAAADQGLKIVQSSASHRGKRITRFVENFKYSVNKLRVGIYEIDGQWIIGPWLISNEEHVQDIGPFQTPEVAWATLQLLKD